MRRREAGRGAAPAGFVATKQSGGIGCSPRDPLGFPARSWLKTRRRIRANRRQNRKRGPVPEMPQNSMRYRFAALARVALRVGALVCRKGTKLSDLRFAARHPPHPEEGQRPVSKEVT